MSVPYRVQYTTGQPIVIDEAGKDVPGALVLKITYGHEPLTDIEGTTVILNGHNTATIVVNRAKIYDVPVVS
jgi:hypothetical protein